MCAAPILDRAAGEPELACKAHRLGDTCGVLGEAVLEVGRHRQLGCDDERRAVRQRLIAADAVVRPAEAGCAAAARRRERLEAEPREQLGGARVPRVCQQ